LSEVMRSTECPSVCGCDTYGFVREYVGQNGSFTSRVTDQNVPEAGKLAVHHIAYVLMFSRSRYYALQFYTFHISSIVLCPLLDLWMHGG